MMVVIGVDRGIVACFHLEGERGPIFSSIGTARNAAMALEAALKACGDDLSTENILRQAYSIRDLELPMLLPGIKVNTSATDHVPVDQMQFMRFNGKTWERFGELLTGN